MYIFGQHFPTLTVLARNLILFCCRSLNNYATSEVRNQFREIGYLHSQTLPAKSLPDEAVRQQVSCLDFRTQPMSWSTLLMSWEVQSGVPDRKNWKCSPGEGTEKHWTWESRENMQWSGSNCGCSDIGGGCLVTGPFMVKQSRFPIHSSNLTQSYFKSYEVSHAHTTI